MADYDKEDGVWRTVGGRRIFIRNGQSLADAMIKSGKFKNLRSDYRKAKAQEEENKSEKSKKINETMDKRASIIKKLDDDTKDLSSYDKYNLAVSKLENNDYSSPTERQYWAGEIERYKKTQSNDTFEVSDLKKKAMETLPKDHIDTHEGDLYLKKTKESTELLNRMKDKDSGMLSTFRDQQTGEEWYDVPFANMGDDYKEKFTPRAKGAKSFEEHGVAFKDKETNERFSDYLRDKYGTDDIDVITTGSEKNAKSLREEFNNKSLKDYQNKMLNDDNYLQANRPNDYLQKIIKENKYASTKHEGFGDYNDDYVPVYKNKIDNTGDFSRANLSNLSDNELTTALNKQSELYHEATNERLGDQRTRNGKMDKIFNTAKKQQYEAGMKKLNEEMEKRDMPRYNIYNEKNGMLLVSSPTKEMAERQLAENKEIDKKLGRQYGWSEENYPSYKVKKESMKQTNEGFEGKSKNGDSLKSQYLKYRLEHPNTKMTYNEFKNQQK